MEAGGQRAVVGDQRNDQDAGDQRNDQDEESDEEDANAMQGESATTDGSHSRYVMPSKTLEIIAKLCPPSPDLDQKGSRKKHGLKKQVCTFVKKLVALAKNHL